MSDTLDDAQATSAAEVADVGARTPKVTVGLPVHNGEKYLEQSLNSLLCQTFEDFELVISDNASTDRTEELCRAHAARDPRIRYERLEKDIGGSPNHNRVFELARGEYFLWGSDDDMRDKEYLARCIEPLEADPDLAICYTRTKYIDMNGDPLDYQEVELDLASPDPLIRFRELIRMDHQIEPQLGLIRSSILRKTRLEGSYADSDRVLLAEIGLHGRFLRLPEELFMRRDHAERLTRSGPRQERTAWFAPDAPKSIVFPYCRQFREYLASIRRAAPSSGVRRACYRLMLGWVATNRRQLLSDLRWGAVLTARRLGYRGRSARRAARRQIGIWGHYNGGNLGDELVVSSMVHNLRERLPEAKLIGFSLGPRDTERRHGLPSHPLRCGDWEMDGKGTGSRIRFIGRPLGWLAELRFLWRSYRRLRGTDLLLVAGSGPISDDWRGPWSHPYAVYKWSRLARLVGARFAIPSVGAGPIDRSLTRTFLLSALGRSTYTSYRDAASAEVVTRLGVEGAQRVVPDMAFGLPVEEYRGKSEGLIGFNPLPYMRSGLWHPDDASAYESYLERTTDFLEYVLAGERRVLLLYSDLQGDVPVGIDLREQLLKRGRTDLEERLLEPDILGVGDLLRAMSRCDAIVAGRYHCILVPSILGVPAVGLAYHHKTHDLMRMLGLSEYCLDVGTFTPESLIERFEALLANADAVRTKQAEIVPGLSAQVAAQFDRLAELA